jgi:hypothetical protein
MLFRRASDLFAGGLNCFIWRAERLSQTYVRYCGSEQKIEQFQRSRWLVSLAGVQEDPLAVATQKYTELRRVTFALRNSLFKLSENDCSNS